MSTAFSGSTINANWSNVNQIEESERLHKELGDLEKKEKNLTRQINDYALQGPQDHHAIIERDLIKNEIEGLKAHMKKRGLEGGRRKKHRRTHRRSKSRRSKSRRSKSRAKKSRRSKH